MAQEAPPAVSNNQTPKKSHQKLLIITLTILGLVALVVAAWLFMDRDKPSPANPNNVVPLSGLSDKERQEISNKAEAQKASQTLQQKYGLNSDAGLQLVLDECTREASLARRNAERSATSRNETLSKQQQEVYQKQYDSCYEEIKSAK